MKWLAAGFAFALSAVPRHAHSAVVRRTLAADAIRQEQRINNGDLEVSQGGSFPGWEGWELGYEVDREVVHGGELSARCRNTTAEEHRGLTYVVELNQTTPTPIVAECWSRAEDVSGGRDGNYSLYLDLTYTDGTPLWGQIAPFKPGTHDWSKRTVSVVPAKPIKAVQVHGIFRGRTGTAWFDDIKLWELTVPEGVKQFDSVPITADNMQDATVVDGTAGIPTVLFLRDVAAQSSFVQPAMELTSLPDGSIRATGRDRGLQVELSATYRRHGKAMLIEGEVRDLSGRDRAVTVVCTHPVQALGWAWHDDQRSRREITSSGTYANAVAIGAGATRMSSRYPLACISGPDRALAVASPLDVPRLWRFGYNADFGELYAAADLGISNETRNFPSRAGFSLALFPCDPAWGFRSALAEYYALFPRCFTKRNTKEGIWMPFTDIATVEGFQDFGFQFQEGAPNVAFDEAHGIYSFVYVEPMSQWLTMPAEMERTPERAIAYAREKAAQGHRQSRAALVSATEDADQRWHAHVTNAPWCDGALFYLNPSPGLTTGSPDSPTQFEHEWATIDSRVRNAAKHTAAWGPWEKGYDIAPGEGRNGSAAARMTRGETGPGAGASQAVNLNQSEARPLVARAWTKAEGVTGDPGNNYALYIDLRYKDGTQRWGFVAEAEIGTHDWQMLERRIVPEKPVHSLSYHLLFRSPHQGSVWFDDAFLAEEGSTENRMRQPGFEAQATQDSVKPFLDGTYIDSFEMAAATLNYRREHFANATIPLTFDGDGRVCQLGVFNTVEFAREAARRMWKERRMMFANSTPNRFPWGAACLDVMGTETNWKRGDAYTPASDAVMNYRRALCYQRPYLLLLNTVYDDFKPEWVELYFKRCTAYGIFPGFFSHNAADAPYWTRPNLYNRDRPLFRKYIPLIQALSAAGWEPVTHARSGNPSVYVERFGKPGGPMFLTVFNDSHEPQGAQVGLDLKALGLRSPPQELADVLTVAPEDVRVVKLSE